MTGIWGSQSSVSGDTALYNERGYGGLLVAGDSFVLDAGAGPTTGFVQVLAGLIGAPWVDVANVVKGGVSGERSDEVLARVPGLLATNPLCRNFVIHCGANDASQLVPSKTFAGNVEQIIVLAARAHCRVLVYGVPPRRAPAAYTAQIKSLLSEYNSALQALCAKHGVAYADVRNGLQDKATGDLISALSSDGLHVNQFGHWIIADVGSAAFREKYEAPNLGLQSEGGPNLIGNGLFLSDLAGWTTAGAAGTFGTASDPYGRLTAGRVASLEFTVGTGPVSIKRTADAASDATWQVGDTIVYGAQMYIDETVMPGQIGRTVFGGSLIAKVLLLNQSNTQLSEAPLAAGTRGGRVEKAMVVPAGTTALQVMVSLYNAASGTATKMYAGQVSLVNKSKYPGLIQY